MDHLLNNKVKTKHISFLLYLSKLFSMYYVLYHGIKYNIDLVIVIDVLMQSLHPLSNKA